MSTSTVDALVADYLRRLSAAAASLPAERRSDLLSGIEEHIADARAAGAAADEAAVRTLLDRLGEPEEIVAAAQEEGEVAYPPPGYPRSPEQPVVLRARGTGLELAAALMLTAGSLIPVVGWLVGVALLWSSRLWRTGEKLLGTLVVPGGPGLVLLVGIAVPGQVCSATTNGTAQVFPPSGPQSDAPAFVTTQSCSGGLPFPTWLTLLVAVVALIAPVVVAVLLYQRARARAALEPPTPVAPRAGRWGGLEITAVALLGLGSFLLPGVGPLVGLLLVYLSAQWTTREKVIATMLAIVPSFLLIVGVFTLSAGGL